MKGNKSAQFRVTSPLQVSTWPTAGERKVKCDLQYATPTTDAMGGRGEPVWTSLNGSWYARVTSLPPVSSETTSSLLYQFEGPYRGDLQEWFVAGVGVRIVTATLTLKVIQVENPQLRNRTLIAHCANAVTT